MLFVAALSRRVSMPEVIAGKLMPTIREISDTTTNSSIRVTPELVFPALELVFPTEDVGIDPISARLSVRPVADDIGLVSVLAGEAILVRSTPGIVFDVLLQIRPLPVLDVLGLHTQRLQALFGGREHAGV